jgi:hypothetical protein
VRVRSQLAPPEVREAWDRYAEEIHGLHPLRVVEIEEWAWARLQARLRVLDRAAKRAAAKKAAA